MLLNLRELLTDTSHQYQIMCEHHKTDHTPAANGQSDHICLIWNLKLARPQLSTQP